MNQNDTTSSINTQFSFGGSFHFLLVLAINGDKHAKGIRSGSGQAKPQVQQHLKVAMVRISPGCYKLF